MINARLLLLLLAVVFFILDALGVAARVKWEPLGFACVVLAFAVA